MHFAENVFSLSDGPKANFSKILQLYNFNCWIIKSAKKLKFDTKNLYDRVPKRIELNNRST